MIMAVTNDRYETPLHFTDSYRSMAKWAGVNVSTVSRQCRGIVQSTSDIKFVEIEQDGWVTWDIENTEKPI